MMAALHAFHVLGALPHIFKLAHHCLPTFASTWQHGVA